MIISNILGGLGNQMFQYAAARALAHANGLEFRLDLSGFANYPLHCGFELARVFDCQAREVKPDEFHKVLGWRAHPLARRVLRHPRFGWLRGAHYIVEPHFHYWPDLRHVPADCYLTGYWQSEKYFLEASRLIRADFTFQLPLENRNAALAEQIDRTNSVSLHIRRGDYVKDPKTAATHGVCSPDYYRAAIQYIATHIEQPHFFVFSDDPAWVRENFRIDFPCSYVDHNKGTESYNDMRLMSLCRHHIIANSSFSWWGAWLNPDAGKLVIAPRKWFANANDVSDLFPEGWVTL